jgi:hypothetical protein
MIPSTAGAGEGFFISPKLSVFGFIESNKVALQTFLLRESSR